MNVNPTIKALIWELNRAASMGDNVCLTDEDAQALLDYITQLRAQLVQDQGAP